MEFKVLGRKISVGKSVSTPLNSPSTSLQSFDSAYWQSFGSTATYKFGQYHNWVEDYKKCPPLKSILDKLNTAFTNGNTLIVDKVSEEVVDVESIEKILAQPNPIQTQTQFEAQRNDYLALYGWCIVMNFRPSGGRLLDPLSVSSRWVLPNEDLTVTWYDKPYYTSDRKNLIKKITYQIGGVQYAIDPKDCFLYTHVSASYVDSSIVPCSPLMGLEYPIGNVTKAFEAEKNLLAHNGAMKIISNDTTDSAIGSSKFVDPEAVEDLKNGYKNYGHQNNQYPFLLTNLHLKVQDLTPPLSDLGLEDIVDANTKEIAQRLGIPTDLLNVGENSKYENQNIAERSMYQNTIIPMAKHIYEQETMDLLEGTNYKIISSFDHVAALQEEEGRKAKAAKDWSIADKNDWQSDLMTRNQILERRGDEPVSGGELYYSQWIKQQENGNEAEA